METDYIAAGTDYATQASELGALLKLSMTQQSISMRQLSKSTGISAPTISRIIAGKQAANVHHLQEFAKHLKLPMEKQLEAMGVVKTEQTPSHHNLLQEMIDDVVADFEIDFGVVVKDILKELSKFEQYARTNEGKKIILDGFDAKMKSIDGAGAIIDKLNNLYSLFCLADTSENKKAVIGSALLYFIWTVGVIPDYLFPIGYLDDAIAVKAVEKKLLQMKD